MSIVTCIAPINIAVIKYWGKRDDNLILPLNDSISVTLDTEHLCATTSVMASPDFKENRIWLNGIEESMDNPRIKNCLQEIKKRGQAQSETLDWKIHICSENNFPTAAGLASSAAGYACLASALAKLYKVEGNISGIARAGSGSACRSTEGGFVRWYMGSDPNGSDSIAKEIAPVSHWPEMRIIILVVNESRKKVSSAEGMKRGVLTSEFLRFRAKSIVPERTEKMHQAIIDKDFQTFAEITMKDSNNMHASCLDTFPPCIYMNDTSFSVVELIHAYNSVKGSHRVAYTFDAGPNPTLYLLEKDVPEVIGLLDHYFPPAIENTSVEYRKGIPIEPQTMSKELLNDVGFSQQSSGKFKYMIYTRAGDGPKYLTNPKDHLLNDSGLPIKN